jgi:hypothetical protein
MNLRLFAGWMLSAAMRACGYVAPYDATIWDNPIPDNAYPGPVPIHGAYYSSAMNVNVGYNVVLPPEYDLHPNARFPVVFCMARALMRLFPSCDWVKPARYWIY